MRAWGNYRVWIWVGLICLCLFVFGQPTSRWSNPTKIAHPFQESIAVQHQEKSATIEGVATRKTQDGDRDAAGIQSLKSAKNQQTSASNENKSAKGDDGPKSTDWIVAIFTIVLAVVAALQAHWTRVAVNAARMSAEIARSAMTDLERAFVVHKKFDTEVGVDAEGTQVLSISTIFENSGTTLTRHLIQHGNMGLVVGNLPTNFDFPDVETGTDPSRFVIGPKASGGSAAFSIPLAALEGVKKGELNFFLWGWAEYDDIFQGTPRHRTEYCFQLTAIIGAISQRNFEYRAYEKHNGMDEECAPESWRTRKGGAWIEPRKPRMKTKKEI